MQEFEFIDTFLRSDADPSLLMGIGDDAAVLSERQILSQLHIKVKKCELDTHSPESIANNLDSLRTLLEASEYQKTYLFINLSLAALNRSGMELYLTELNRLLKTYKTILAGGDTTHGNGTVIYQLIGTVPKEDYINLS